MADIFDLFRKISTENQTPKAPITWIVAGLGNPGAEYTHTRHNAGFLALDTLAARWNVKVDRVKFHALVGEATFGGVGVLLMKPQTMMNASGTAVGEAASFYKIPPEHVIVISDDIAQIPAAIRIRKKGSAGGHNGLKDIIAHLGSEEFPRVRIGVGEKPHPDYDLVNWVLGEFSDADLKKLAVTNPVVAEGIEKILAGKIDDAIQLCNSHKPENL